MKTFCLLFVLPLCAACGANEPMGQDAQADEAPFASDAKDVAPGGKVMTQDSAAELPNVFAGKVQGFDLDVVETVFVEGSVDMGTQAPVLVVVQSSAKGICAHLQNATYPKDGTFFPMALIQADGKPMAAHRLYKPSNPDDESTDSYFTFAQLRHFDATCAIAPAAEDGMAVLGQLVLDDYAAKEHVAGRFAFKMGEARDAVEGSFNATFCDAPNLFADYMNLMNPVIDDAHCF